MAGFHRWTEEGLRVVSPDCLPGAIGLLLTFLAVLASLSECRVATAVAQISTSRPISTTCPVGTPK
jgi:hypothetical protein